MQNTVDVCSVLLLLNVLNFPFQEGFKDEEQCPTGAQPTYLSEALLNIFFPVCLHETESLSFTWCDQAVMIQLQKAVGTVSQVKHTSRHKYLKQGAWLFDFFFKNKI